MAGKIDPLWDKYISLTHRREDIRLRGKRKTFCSNCYKEVIRTDENNGYSGCCTEEVIEREDAIDQISEEVRQVLDDIEKVLDHEQDP